MKRHLVLVYVLLIVLTNAAAQLPDDFPVIERNDLPGAVFTSSKVYNGTSLFGYIDGGAELYLEYGFLMASVTDINYKDGIYKTEIYKMTGPEEAFGIFSVSRFRCKSVPGLPGISCQSKYQLQICRGQFYISIINRTGTRNDSIASVLIGKSITGRIRGNDADLNAFFPDIDDYLLKSGCFLAKGRLGIVNGSPDLEDFLIDYSGYTAVIYKNDRTNISLRFDNAESCRKFADVNSFKEGKSQTGLTVRKIDDCHFLIEIIG